VFEKSNLSWKNLIFRKFYIIQIYFTSSCFERFCMAFVIGSLQRLPLTNAQISNIILAGILALASSWFV
jgi:hypothetical protein